MSLRIDSSPQWRLGTIQKMADGSEQVYGKSEIGYMWVMFATTGDMIERYVPLGNLNNPKKSTTKRKVTKRKKPHK